MRVGYLTFGRDDFGYGMALCLDAIKDKHEIYRVTPKTARHVDMLLFSCFWWEHVYLLANFLRSAKIRLSDAKRPKIIVGGFNTFNPVPFAEYADSVVVGDGEEILLGLLDGMDAPGVYRKGIESVKWQNVSPLPGFCHETNGVARIEIARGCKYRCKFCAVAHLKPYREVPAEEIIQLLRKTSCKSVSTFAPEPTLHSQDDEITQACIRLGKSRMDSDVRLDRLEHRSMSVPRIGLDGLSERLRKSVGKPYSSEQVIEAIRKAIAQGRKGMFVYLILDLPGEAEEDFAEFRELLIRCGEIPGASEFLLKISPNVFMPNPHTPMEMEPIHWDRPYGQMWSDFFGRGEDRTWEMMIAERSRAFSPAMRVLSMLSTRSGKEFLEIEEELSRNRAIGISGGRVICRDLPRLLRVLDRCGGVDRYCEIPTEIPWKAVMFA